MSLLDAAPVPRRTMVLFFIVDTSGSMAGSKIGSLNAALREVIPMLDEISANNADAEIKIATLQFSSGCEWTYSEPKLAENFEWVDLTAGGLTDLGEACLELNSKLSRNAFMQSANGSFAPVLILFSDGGPTDNFHGGISKLKENRWFKAAIKIAVAIGDQDVDKDVLKEFTGNIEAVFEVTNVQALKKVIRVVSVTSSQIGSQSCNAGAEATDKATVVIETVKKEIEDVDGAHSAGDPVLVSTDSDWD